MQKLLFLISLFLLSSSAFSSHFVGGAINYKKTANPNEYYLTLEYYHHCGLPAPVNVVINLSNDCNNNTLIATLGNTGGGEVSQICSNSIGGLGCGGGNGRQKAIYSGLVTLPSNCAFWHLSYTDAGSRLSVNIGSSPSTFIESTLNNTLGIENNSAIIMAPPMPYVSLNTPTVVNLGFYDFDCDSLAFSITSPKISATTNTTFVSGFSYLAPISGIVINPLNGELSFTPTQVGDFTIAVLVEEYNANGVLKGSVVHDFQILVNPGNNQQPTFTGISNFSNNGTNSTFDAATNSISMCAGDEFCFDLSLSDADLSDILTIESNILSALPNSTISYSGQNPVIATICWQYQNGFTQNCFIFEGDDNICDYYGLDYFLLHLDLPNPLDLDYKTAICGNDSSEIINIYNHDLIWSNYLGDTINIGGNFSCLNCPNPFIKPDTTSSYIVQTPDGCAGVDTVTIEVLQNLGNIVNDLSISDTIICENDCIDLSNSSAYYNIFPISSSAYNATTDYIIPPTSTVSSSVYVVASGTINSDIFIKSVCIDIACSADQLLDIYLVSPSGTLYELSTGNGGSLGANYINTCFVSSAVSTINIFGQGALPPFTGDYYPEAGALENAFNGESSQGLWKLQVTYNGASNFGVLENWSLELDKVNTIPVSPTHFSWSNTNGLDSLLVAPIICPDTSGAYVLTIYDQYDCFISDTVNISINNSSSAGNDTTISLNVYSGINDLDNYITSIAIPNGLWSDSVYQTLTNSIFNPDTLSIESDYYYTVLNSFGCEDTALLTVIVNGYCDTPPNPPNPNVLALPNAGDDTYSTLNQSLTQVNLFAFLLGSPDTGGVWYDSNNSSFSGVVNIASATFTDTYYYVVESIYGCIDTAYITIHVLDDLSIDKLDAQVEVKFYPNPFNSSLSIESDLVITKVEIIDISGRIVFEEKFESFLNILNLNELSQGLYTVNVFGIENELMKTNLIIKE